MSDRPDIAAVILRLAAERGAEQSFTPDEVAQAVADQWRPLLGAVRREAARLAEAGAIDILRKGRPVPPAEMRGVIRLRLKNHMRKDE